MRQLENLLLYGVRFKTTSLFCNQVLETLELLMEVLPPISGSVDPTVIQNPHGILLLGVGHGLVIQLRYQKIEMNGVAEH